MTHQTLLSLIERYGWSRHHAGYNGEWTEDRELGAKAQRDADEELAEVRRLVADVKVSEDGRKKLMSLISTYGYANEDLGYSKRMDFYGSVMGREQEVHQTHVEIQRFLEGAG